MDKQSFMTLMATAKAAYQLAELSNETIEIYWRALGGFPADDVQSRLDDHIKREKFFPRISDLKPVQRPALGPRYLEAPRRGRGLTLANQVLLALLVEQGGVGRPKLKELLAVKNAEANDYDEEAGKSPEYRRQFVKRVEAELREQLCV